MLIVYPAVLVSKLKGKAFNVLSFSKLFMVVFFQLLKEKSD